MSSKSKKIKKPQAFVPDGLLQMRAQLSRFNHQIFYVFQQHYRMEARIEAVEEELRQEKQKNAVLEQSHLSASLNPAESCQDIVDLATVSQSIADGKKAKTAPSSGAGDCSKTKRELKKRSSHGGHEVNKIWLQLTNTLT